MSNIILGDGVYAVGTKDVALTRGGGQFVVTRENKEVLADGDFGPVKGRVRKDRSVATLTMNLLTVLAPDLATMYPATVSDTVTTVTTFEPKADIEDGDYNDTVTWTGKTDDGQAVVITLENAINLGNIDWTMVDKDEVIPQIVMTGTYLETDRTAEPWNVTFTTAV